MIRAGLLRIAPFLLVAPLTLDAQRATVNAAGTPVSQTSVDTVRRGTRPPIDVEFGQSTLRSRGGSDFFALADRALSPGADALRPRGWRGGIRYWVHDRLAVRTSVAWLATDVNSTSRVAPPGETVGQRTTWNLTAWDIVGGEWSALRWHNPSMHPREFQLLLGAGVGMAAYRIRQDGRFVDASRVVSYADDFRSSGRGATGYLGAAAELAPSDRMAVRLDWRWTRGTAPMNEDFVTFDNLDLGGQQLNVGIVLRPMGRLHRGR